MLLEKIINKTIELYDQNNIALFHKKNVPIMFDGIKYNGLKLKLKNGWIAKKSTTDYYGIYKGKFIAFEAKSTNLTSLPIANIKLHQQKYLEKIKNYEGISFYIIAYEKFDAYFIIPAHKINKIKNKSLNIKIAKNIGYKLDLVYPGILDFIPILKKIK